MKVVLGLVCLLALASALPYVEQMLLASSMIVGRDDGLDLLNWECNVCDPTNRPLHAHFIEEKEKDVKCVLAVYPTFVVLAFRYTNTLLNVWQDILYANQVVDSNVCSNCKIQKAYKKMWDTIVEDVLADLRLIRAQTGLKKIYITGISLGGGLSVISEIDVKNAKIFDQVQVINYGSPRVANKYYADFHDAASGNSTVRFIVKGDPIVVLPECLTILCNYKHVGRQYVCIEEEQVCRGNLPVPEGPFSKLAWKIHADPSQKNLGSIVDHIYGYKKIYNFTIVEN
jgi:hypothetical protein